MVAPLRLRTAVLIMSGLILAALVILLGGCSTPAPSAPVVEYTAPTTHAAPSTHETYVIPPRDTRNEAQCRAAAYRMYLTQDYLGSATERACFGEEDDPRVGLALDYGMTSEQYALAEQGDESAYLPCAPYCAP